MKSTDLCPAHIISYPALSSCGVNPSLPGEIGIKLQNNVKIYTKNSRIHTVYGSYGIILARSMTLTKWQAFHILLTALTVDAFFSLARTGTYELY